MTDVQPDTEIPPDLQALINDLAEEGRMAFERDASSREEDDRPEQPALD
jgi:hypothetical protein